jgi:hypothetical protein
MPSASWRLAHRGAHCHGVPGVEGLLFQGTRRRRRLHNCPGTFQKLDPIGRAAGVNRPSAGRTVGSQGCFGQQSTERLRQPLEHFINRFGLLGLRQEPAPGVLSSAHESEVHNGDGIIPLAQLQAKGVHDRC